MSAWAAYRIGGNKGPDGKALRDVAREIASSRGRPAREKELVEAGFAKTVVRSYLRSGRR